MTEIVDNRAFRSRTMKEIIRRLHEGGNPDEVRAKLKYFAVRDEEDQYQGTLEVTQDATRIRSLEGEQRLLQYGR